MNYEKLDKITKFKDRDLLLTRVHDMGYDFISEALVEIHRETQSIRATSRIMEMPYPTVRRMFKKWGVEFNTLEGTVPVGGMSITEIAREMGESEQAIYYTLKVGLKKFRRAWKHLYGEFDTRGETDAEMFRQAMTLSRREGE